MSKINIAIDGPSGVGKSTISKYISKNLGYVFINSGSVYRAIAFYLHNKKIDVSNEVNVVSIFPRLEIKISNDDVILNGFDISHQIREQAISKIASIIAKYKQVREYVINYVHNLIKNQKGFVMDGRDTTFRLMPNAEVKIFLWASVESRAQRRLLQDHQMGFNSKYEDVLEDVKKRDFNDMNREVDPLHQTKDAIHIDCTTLNEQQTIDKIIEIIKKAEKTNE